MKILLTHAYFLKEDTREQKIMRPYPPLGILNIAAFLEQHQMHVDVFDTTFSTKQHFEKYLTEYRPEILGIYVNLMTKLNVLNMIQYIKGNLPNTKVILGGPEVTYSAENFLRHGADFIVIGEGEQTMLELCQGIGRNASLSSMHGVAYLENNKFVQTPEREKLKQLDELPAPARHKIDLHKYLSVWKERHGKNTVSISTMRGCPYTCKWCSRSVYGLSYRRRSPEKVVEELKAVQQEYNPDSFWFVDDVFTISHKWMEAFRDALKKNDVKIQYECITRSDRMNEEIIQILKETGCFRVWIGAESGSQKVIDLMDRRVKVDQVRQIIQLTKSFGIETGTFIMLGYPGETQEDIFETIQHLKESDPDLFTITVAYPIRGTELYQEIAPLQNESYDWTTTTDRQIDFKRTYSRRYYDWAVRWVISEVEYYRSRKRKETRVAAKEKIKSILAKTGMEWHKRFT